METLYLFIYFLICLYTNWRIKITNQSFYLKNPDYNQHKSNTEMFWLEMMIIFYGVFFVGTLLYNGVKVLEHKRNIFSGELL